MDDSARIAAALPARNDTPPVVYDRAPEYGMITEKDAAVPMRDGINLSVDIYRPDAPGRFPALLAFAIYNKDFQGPDIKDVLPRSRAGRRCGPVRSKPAIQNFSPRAGTFM